MSSAYVFFWYVLPILIAAAGWGVAAYVTRHDPRPPAQSSSCGMIAAARHKPRDILCRA